VQARNKEALSLLQPNLGAYRHVNNKALGSAQRVMDIASQFHLTLDIPHGKQFGGLLILRRSIHYQLVNRWSITVLGIITDLLRP